MFLTDALGNSRTVPEHHRHMQRLFDFQTIQIVSSLSSPPARTSLRAPTVSLVGVPLLQLTAACRLSLSAAAKPEARSARAGFFTSIPPSVGQLRESPLLPLSTIPTSNTLLLFSLSCWRAVVEVKKCCAEETNARNDQASRNKGESICEDTRWIRE